MNRRDWLRGASMLAGAALQRGVVPAAPAEAPVKGRPCALALEDFQPKSMLKVKETHVPRAKFPVIDFHTHLSHSARTVNGVAMVSARTYASPPAPLVAVMDRKNIRTMVNLTGGYGEGLRETIAKYDRAYPGRFVTFTEPCYEFWREPKYTQIQADAIARAHQDGARGLKILKTLGLYLRENITTGKLVRVDDPRFDPMWDACGQLGMPVAIHVADPEAFFLPTDRFNERYEELSHHPDWSFYGRDFPTVAEILEARNRILARHPKTNFVVLHVGNHAEDLGDVTACLDRFPNMHVDLAARIGELGRQPRTARKFFDKYQDRIVLGTDATPHGDSYPQQVFNDRLYEIYYRFLETDDEYFDYAPSDIPPQGRWRIYGIDLSETILRKVYHENAARQLGMNA
ncbi:amidohydrolase family protein [Silvibacterium acidisoli]|uniref:amidohydrolase family protein n=1 Tax=Acidobacteriaceae bacterium ZG23-2 TaxID=2883246 RepID=UPI00406D2A15